MGKTYRELKEKIGKLRFENSFLTSKVEKVLLENGRVKRELQVGNARIVELAQEMQVLRDGLPFLGEVKEALEGFSVGLDYVPTEFDDLVSLGYMEEFTVPEKNKTSSLHSSSDADRELELFACAIPPEKQKPSVWDAYLYYQAGDKVMLNGRERVMAEGINNPPNKEDCDIGMFFLGAFCKAKILEEDGYKTVALSPMPFNENMEIRQEQKAFTSRFMPDVKFKICGDEDNLISVLSYEQLRSGYKYFKIIPSTDNEVDITATEKEIIFMRWSEKEVCIYEAIPELVPDGMVYDKESDSLIKKDKR